MTLYVLRAYYILMAQDEVVNFRIPTKNKEALKRAASAAGMPLSSWLRAVSEAAAGVSELPEHLKRLVRERDEVPDGEW